MRYIITLALSILPLAARAEVPRVITDIPPVYGLVASVMGDLGQPVLLLEKGAGAHDFQLRPSQMRDITAAELLVWVGPRLTGWLERALDNADAGLISLPLLDLPQTVKLEFGAAEDEHGHDEHGHEKEEHDEHGHHHEGTDPHAWLNPENAAIWIDAIAQALSDLDAGNAAIYAVNAAKAKADIAALDAELAAALAPVKDKGFVAFHDAYRYFTAHYRLAYKGAVALSDATDAGAAHLSKMRAIIADGVACVFPEAQHDGQALLQLIEGTGAKAGAALDPEGSALDATRDAYTDTLRGLTRALTECLGPA